MKLCDDKYVHRRTDVPGIHGFDMLILGFMPAAISADLGLTSAQAGSLVTWTMLGAVAGGLLFVWGLDIA